MAFRVLALLAVICAIAGTALLVLHAFSYVIAFAIAAVFAFGALTAKTIERWRLRGASKT
jgi:hypothetical protein